MMNDERQKNSCIHHSSFIIHHSSFIIHHSSFCIRHASFTPQHFLYFFPLPHGHGSFRPTLGWSRTICLIFAAASPCISSAAAEASDGAPTSAVSRRFSDTP